MPCWLITTVPRIYMMTANTTNVKNNFCQFYSDSQSLYQCIRGALFDAINLQAMKLQKLF